MTGDRARLEILGAIAGALATEPLRVLPEPMQIFRDDATTDRAVLARQFERELKAIGGETFFVAREEDLAAAIAAYVAKRGLGSASTDFAEADYALLRAESFLADTGSAVVIERSAARRLAPYLPRTCIIVGNAAVLHAHMTAEAMQAVVTAAHGGDRGEAVIITGPSRTADIEKTVVLGAHGPRDLAVFIVGIDSESTA